MKVKSIFTAFASLAMVFSLTAPSVLASEVKSNEDEGLYVQTTDLNKLYVKALNGISDVTGAEQNKFTSNAFDETTELEEQFDVETHMTTQFLGEKQVNGEIVQEYETITFQVAQDEEDTVKQFKQDKIAQKKSEGMIGTFSSKTDDKWDSTIGVKAYSTVTWTKETKGGVIHLKLSKVSGGWSYNGSGGYSLSARSVSYGQVGPSSYGGTNKQTVTKNPTTNTFSYTVSSDWNPVVATQYTTCGVSTKITISRSGSSWKLDFSNMAG